MVESVEISRVNIRDTLSLDISVWMNHPDDMDFRPSLSCKDKTFTISSITSGETLASIELDDEQLLLNYGSNFRFTACMGASIKSLQSSLMGKPRNSQRPIGRLRNRSQWNREFPHLFDKCKRKHLRLCLLEDWEKVPRKKHALND